MSAFNTLTQQGAWASGRLLVATHGAVLPPYCIKCGRPTETNIFRRKFSWHEPWLYVFILFAIVLYLVVAMFFRKHMTMEIPLCDSHLEKYKSLRWSGILLISGAVPETSATYAHRRPYRLFLQRLPNVLTTVTSRARITSVLGRKRKRALGKLTGRHCARRRPDLPVAPPISA